MSEYMPVPEVDPDLVGNVSKRVSRVSYASDRSQPHSTNYDTEGPLRPPTSSLPVHYEEDGPLRPNRKSRIETFAVEKAKDAPNRRISQARPSRTERPPLEDLKKEIRIDEHTIPLEILFLRLRSDPEKGLTCEEAHRRLLKDGPNELTPPKTDSELSKFLHHMFTGFSILLWIGTVLCFIAYGLQYLTVRPEEIVHDNLYLGIALLLVVTVSSTFAYWQERKSSDIMNSFKKLVPAFAVVIRDGVKQSVHTTDIVKGDVIHVTMGDRMPADIVILEAQAFKVDNSSITGESEPVSRNGKFTHENPLETKNLAFYSTSVMQGTAIGVVIYTGDNTVMGRVANLASNIEQVKTPLNKELDHVILVSTSIAFLMGGIFFTLSLLYGFYWLDSVIFLIGLIVAYVPEGLQMTVTICLTLTAQRMAKKNCLVKNLDAVETLGSTSIICTDKTGTLTQNRMTVAHVWMDGVISSVDTTENQTGGSSFDKTSPTWKRLSRVTRLCNRAVFQPNQSEDLPILKREATGDASESAIFKFTELHEPGVVKYRETHNKRVEIPFNSTNKYQISIHEQDDGRDHILQMKGAPERILNLCSTILIKGEEVPLTDEWKEKFESAYRDLGEMGERVLGFCDLILPEAEFPQGYPFDSENQNFPLNNLCFLGLLALIDPPRAAVPDAVEKCRRAGIKIIMVTGDHPITAKAIARKVGIISPDGMTANEMQEKFGDNWRRKSKHNKVSAIVLHGEEIKQMSSEDLIKVVQSYPEIVFARTSPQQKLLIVEACQATGAIVAVTGDGVNDSPALSKADIGIAMGISGSEVSKQAADMILMDDNFASIVTGVEEGRVIFDNLKKAIVYTLTSKGPETLPFLAFILLDLPLSLGTAMILLIDFSTDLMPAISLVHEVAEADIMTRRPRNAATDHLVNPALLQKAYFQIGIIEGMGGMFAFLVVLGESGFWPMSLIGIRPEWDNPSVDVVVDSYGQEWNYRQRKNLEQTGQSAYFLAIVFIQWINVLTCRSRRYSIFNYGMRNSVMNFALIFEFCFAMALIYTPGMEVALRFRPLQPLWFLPGLPFGLLVLFYDEMRKLIMRLDPGGFIDRETYY
ncbi:Sodium/potassium-transporting ATPase subunit alpha-B [Hypsibius exemplaris]|uniref:Sodium/potassium-transporting ATPase subunit alpha n=1 Tax=Hypsibius exemplaris TaxID=2072580 RepID=A0A1W0XCW0_HYPEX|nr:Sodium/potassium-transporting ATPase subunit alpha-B [Hypsibius exemplaris]